MCEKCLMLSLRVTRDTRWRVIHYLSCYIIMSHGFKNFTKSIIFALCCIQEELNYLLAIENYCTILMSIIQNKDNFGYSIYLLSWLFRLKSRLHARNSVSLLFQYGLLCWDTMESFIHVVLWYNITSLVFFSTKNTSP